MAHKKVTGTRPLILWGIIAIIVVLVVVAIAGLLVIYPDYQARQDAAQATVQAQAQLEQHYQAGIAFQSVEDWEAAEAEFKQVITFDASYKDVQTRLADVKVRRQEALTTVQAQAAQATATAQAQAAATAAAATVEAGVAQATSVAATATAQARATAQAQGAKATATAEALTQLEEHYQKGLGYINIGRWEEAKAELEQVFEVDPNYKEVQAELAAVQAEIAKLTPTSMPTPIATPTSKPTATMQVVYSNGFEGTVGSEWSNTSIDTTPSSRRFLGQFDNGTVTLTLTDLPPHTNVTVSFRLYIIQSWDGNQRTHPESGSTVGPDEWNLSVADGPTLLHTTFSNIDKHVGSVTFPQAYPDTYPGGNNPPGSGAAEIDTLGYKFIESMDSVYQLEFTFPHSTNVLRLNFSATGLTGVPKVISDESWGLDDVVVLTKGP